MCYADVVAFTAVDLVEEGSTAVSLIFRGLGSDRIQLVTRNDVAFPPHTRLVRSDQIRLDPVGC